MAHANVSDGVYNLHAGDVRGGVITRWLVTLAVAAPTRGRLGSVAGTDLASVVRDNQPIAQFVSRAAPSKSTGSSAPIAGPLQTLNAPIAGTLRLHREHDAYVASIRFCTHAAQTEGSLCILCGADTSRLSPSARAILHAHFASAGVHVQPVVVPARIDDDSVSSALVAASSRALTSLPSVSPPARTTLSDILGMVTGSASAPPAYRPREQRIVEVGTPSSVAAAEMPGMRSYKGRDGFMLKLSDGYADLMDAQRASRLRSKRLLTLVLDLDHTLIHAIDVPDDATRDCVHAIAAAHEGVHIFTEGSATFAVKLRPHVRDFLRDCAALFELQVDTAATRAYAKRVCDILDPTGDLFGDRIVSRCDTKLKNQKETAWLHRSLTDHSMVLILDDTEVVWPGAKNLILIERYIFWSQEQGHATNQPGQSHTRVEEEPSAAGAASSVATSSVTVVEEPHPYLDDMHRLLSQLHAQYYETWDATGHAPSTQALLTRHMSSVLRDVCLCFSGVFPLAINPSAHPFYRRVLKFGAAIADTVWASTSTSIVVQSLHNVHPLTTMNDTPAKSVLTHVVARVGGTQKVYDAAACPNVRIVAVSWLEETCRRYARQAESLHLLPGYEAHATREQSEVVAALNIMRMHDDRARADPGPPRVEPSTEAASTSGSKRRSDDVTPSVVEAPTAAPTAVPDDSGDADLLLHDSDLEASLHSGETASGQSDEEGPIPHGDIVHANGGNERKRARRAYDE